MKNIPRYVYRILDGGFEPDPADVVVVAARHDDYCRCRNGGPCDCRPSIELGLLATADPRRQVRRG